MFKLSEIYWKTHFNLIGCEEVEGRERARALLREFENYLPSTRYRYDAFISKLREHSGEKELLWWQEDAVSAFNALRNGDLLPTTRPKWEELLLFAESSTPDEAVRSVIASIGRAASSKVNYGLYYRTPPVYWAGSDPSGEPELRKALHFAKQFADDLLRALIFLRFALRLAPSSVSDEQRELLKRDLALLGGSAAALGLPASELLGLLSSHPGEGPVKEECGEIARVVLSVVNQNRAHLDASGRWMVFHHAINLAHTDVVFALDLMADVEEFSHEPDDGVWQVYGADRPGRVWPGILLRDFFEYMETNTDAVARNAAMLGYGFASIRESAPLCDPADFGTPRAWLRFRRQEAVAWLTSNLEGWRRGGLSGNVTERLHTALFDIDPAVRQDAANLLGAVGLPESALHLRQLLEYETTSTKVRSAAANALSMIGHGREYHSFQ